MLWLYLRLPCLQLDTQLPDLDTPAAVVDERENRIRQLNGAARDQGIRADMGLATAAALCRDIQLLPYKLTLEIERLEELAQGLYDLSGDLTLDLPCDTDFKTGKSCGIWLGATRMVKYHNGFDNYCDNIKAFLSHYSLSYQLASGFSPASARLLAHTRSPPLDASPERLWRACRQAPLSAAEFPEDTLASLARLGMRRMGDLLAIPRPDLARRFDRTLADYLARLTGQCPHPLPIYQPRESFCRHRELPHELTALARLKPWLQQLLNELEEHLTRRDQVVERTVLALFLRDREPLHLTTGSARGEGRAQAWLPLMMLNLERLTLQAPVQALTLSAPQPQPRRHTSGGLLEARSGQSSSAELVSLLQARLGPERVTGLGVHDDYRPLRASGESPPLSSPPSATAPVLRPAFLLPEPQSLRGPLAIIDGPERITAGWWDGAPEIRDYYIARNREGQWCWIFHEPAEDRGWFLQGLFA